MNRTKGLLRESLCGLALVFAFNPVYSATPQALPSSTHAQPQQDAALSRAGVPGSQSQGGEVVREKGSIDSALIASGPRSPTGNAATYFLIPSSGPLSVASISGTANKDADWTSSLATVLSSFAWPLAVFLIVWRLLKHPKIGIALSMFWRRAVQINVAGLEIKLNDGAEATVEDIKRLVSMVPGTHQDWVNNSHFETRFQLVVSGLRAFVTSREFHETPLAEKSFRKFRFTLHVPDPLLAHSVRQLVDYVGCGRGGAGRIFSTRRGIIGLAWRLEKSRLETENYSEDDLVERWGMTRGEANDATHDKGVLMVFVIKNPQQVPIAMLYADAADSDLFSSQLANDIKSEAFARIDARVLSLCKLHGLIDSLEELEKARAKIVPVDVYRPATI